MKKVTLLVTLLLMVAVSSFADKRVFVVSGNPSVLKQAGKTCIAEFDYSKTMIEGQEVMAYLQKRGQDNVKTWPEDNIRTEGEFYSKFNKENSKGTRLLPIGTTTADYKILFHVSEIDLGNTAVSVVLGGGGCSVSGMIEIIDMQTNTTVCKIVVDHLKGISQYSEVTRRGATYHRLADRVCDLIKNGK